MGDDLTLPFILHPFILHIVRKGILLITWGLCFVLPLHIIAMNPPEPAGTSHPHQPQLALKVLLDALDEEQIESVQFPFESAERMNWHYFPRDREGLGLGQVNELQKALLFSVMGEFLSPTGLAKSLHIIELERILGELTNNEAFRDPEKYYLSLFKSADDEKGPWGLRFEGHHLSLNYVVDKGKVVSATPSFMGANPAVVPRGAEKGLQVLRDEEVLARLFMKSLSPRKQEMAMVADVAYPDILTGAEPRVESPFEGGIAFGELSADEQAALKQLVSIYLDSHHPDWSATMMAGIEMAGWDRILFAWAGELEPGQGHYYRIQGPTILIEYDNTQGGANHIHTVLRDPRNDFGRDYLAEHLAAEH